MQTVTRILHAVSYRIPFSGQFPTFAGWSLTIIITAVTQLQLTWLLTTWQPLTGLQPQRDQPSTGLLFHWPDCWPVALTTPPPKRRRWLCCADLTGADLTAVYLTGADLTSAYLTGWPISCTVLIVYINNFLFLCQVQDNRIHLSMQWSRKDLNLISSAIII